MAPPAPPADAGWRVAVAVDTPQHSGLAGVLDYRGAEAIAPGTLVRAPLGRRELLGIVWDAALPGTTGDGVTTADADAAAAPSLRPLAEVFDALPPLAPNWRRLVEFAAAYYQRGVGELALSVLPPQLRSLHAAQLAKRVARLLKPLPAAVADGATPADAAVPADAPPPLNDEQQAAVARIEAAFAANAQATLLLHGVTGSGKTEVYLQAAASALSAGRQVLLLVPEINLTPQLESRLAARFRGRRLASLHSGLSPAERLRHWLAAHLGLADVVLGTRLAVFASLPRLGLIVVDEEHDPSFKQQEGARYSARDLAVYRGRLEGVPVVLGSATPSLESWQRAEQGRYQRIQLRERIGGGALPVLRMVDLGALHRQRATGAEAPPLAPPLQDAISQRIERGEQSLLLLNRRGYAPVLHCTACGWQSGCPHCSAWRVFHKRERSLRCHHCGFAERVPRACPECGNLDLQAVGRGTERLEEQLQALLPQARILRIDGDSMRTKGALQQRLAAVHDGAVDVLVGTQMVAKGHDFRRITLVAAVNPDGALFASDFRAPERLFALLMQAAGRAGRDARHAAASEMWVQSWHPGHPLYAALARHDFAAFAASQLAERRSAGLPPFTSLALLRAEAREAAAAAAFLRDAAALAEQPAESGTPDVARAPGVPGVHLYDPIAPALARVAGVERMQMLVESPSRAALQRFLAGWLPALHAMRASQRARHPGLLRWAVDVDPLTI